MFDYPGASDRARLDLSEIYGLSDTMQERIGAFVVLFGMFESYLEWSIWGLRGVTPKGERPWTDTKNVTALIDECRKACESHPKIADIVKLACKVGEDLAMYRNAIAHGYLMPKLGPGPAMGLFMTNLTWHGEIRKRPSQDAYVDENYLDLAIYSAQTIAKTMTAVYFFFKEPAKYSEEVVLQFSEHLSRARSMANELRHATELMNHEKY